MKAMSRIVRRRFVAVLVAGALVGALSGRVWPGAAADTKSPTVQTTPGGWVAAAPRDEIRPEFAYNPHGGPDGQGCLAVTADRREGLDGWWTKSFPVTGGRHYRFTAHY